MTGAPATYPCMPRLMEAVRRERMLRRMKQSHLAEILSVAQSSVSRWESGEHVPPADMLDRLAAFVAASPAAPPAAILIRLVERSESPVHLVCDRTHRLLAASRPRRAAWRLPQARDVPLWPYATRQIREAEERLADCGWEDEPNAAVFFRTDGSSNPCVPIDPSTVLWERVPLGNGFARLVTTLGDADPPPDHARAI